MGRSLSHLAASRSLLLPHLADLAGSHAWRARGSGCATKPLAEPRSRSRLLVIESACQAPAYRSQSTDIQATSTSEGYFASSTGRVSSIRYHSPWALPLSASLSLSLSLSPAACCSWARLLHSPLSISTSTPTSTHKAELLLQLLRPSFKRPFIRNRCSVAVTVVFGSRWHCQRHRRRRRRRRRGVVGQAVVPSEQVLGAGAAGVGRGGVPLLGPAVRGRQLACYAAYRRAGNGPPPQRLRPPRPPRGGLLQPPPPAATRIGAGAEAIRGSGRRGGLIVGARIPRPRHSRRARPLVPPTPTKEEERKGPQCWRS